MLSQTRTIPHVANTQRLLLFVALHILGDDIVDLAVKVWPSHVTVSDIGGSHGGEIGDSQNKLGIVALDQSYFYRQVRPY
eukprot:SAG31_NODE_9233_length_1311_cov_17.669142_2_plen_80_part_00